MKKLYTFFLILAVCACGGGDDNDAPYNSGGNNNGGGNTEVAITGTVTNINDYNSPSYSFDELFLSYQLGGKYDWLTFAAGQFPLYNFDGTAYDANQQVNFINYALSQNASSTYPTSSLGSYIQIAPNDTILKI